MAEYQGFLYLFTHIPPFFHRENDFASKYFYRRGLESISIYKFKSHPVEKLKSTVSKLWRAKASRTTFSLLLSLSLFFERSPRGFSHVLNSRLEGAYLSTGGETSGGRAKSSRRGVATEYVTVTYCFPCRERACFVDGHREEEKKNLWFVCATLFPPSASFTAVKFEATVRRSNRKFWLSIRLNRLLTGEERGKAVRKGW